MALVSIPWRSCWLRLFLQQVRDPAKGTGQWTHGETNPNRHPAQAQSTLEAQGQMQSKWNLNLLRIGVFTLDANNIKGIAPNLRARVQRGLGLNISEKNVTRNHVWSQKNFTVSVSVPVCCVNKLPGKMKRRTSALRHSDTQTHHFLVYCGHIAEPPSRKNHSMSYSPRFFANKLWCHTTIWHWSPNSILSHVSFNFSVILKLSQHHSQGGALRSTSRLSCCQLYR